MIKKPILLTLACGLLFSTGCAAKNRWFSRKDYSEIQDPFMETEAVASKDESAIFRRISRQRGPCQARRNL
jgi:hypothetical protein